MFTLAWQRPELWQSHIVLLVLVLLVLARGFRCVDLFLFDHGSVGLCRVADVVTTLVYMVGAFVSVPVFIHSIKQDENAQRRCCYDADHHPRSTARLPEDLRCSWVTLWSSTSGIGCKAKKNKITAKKPRFMFHHYFDRIGVMNESMHFSICMYKWISQI